MTDIEALESMLNRINEHHEIPMEAFVLLDSIKARFDKTTEALKAAKRYDLFWRAKAVGQCLDSALASIEKE